MSTNESWKGRYICAFTVGKGEGRQGLLNAVGFAMFVRGARVTQGDYVIIKVKEEDPKDKA